MLLSEREAVSPDVQGVGGPCGGDEGRCAHGVDQFVILVRAADSEPEQIDGEGGQRRGR